MTIRKILTNVGGQVSEYPITDILELLDAAVVESLAESSTTSATYQQKVRLTFTPLAAADYVVSFSALMSSSNQTRLIKCRILQDSSVVHKESLVSVDSAATYAQGGWHPVAGQFLVSSLSVAAHTFDMEFCTSSGGSGGGGSGGGGSNTAYIKEAHIHIRRID